MIALLIQNTNKKPEEIKRIVTEELTRAMRDTIIAGERRIAEKTPVGVSGHTRQGITGRVVDALEGQIGVQGPASKHAEFVESGRRRGKFPPPAPIELWLKRTDKGRAFVASVKAKYKLKDDKAALKQATYLKQKGIGLRGTRGAFMFKESTAAIAKAAEVNFNAAIKRIERQVSDK